MRGELLVEYRKYSQTPFAPHIITVRGKGGGRITRSYCDHVEQQRQASISIQVRAEGWKRGHLLLHAPALNGATSQDAADSVTRLTDLLEPYRPSIAARCRHRLKELRGDPRRAGEIKAEAGALPLISTASPDCVSSLLCDA